jgi:16S rRNA (cytidine1402-2'-O)-methyltransferase
MMRPEHDGDSFMPLTSTRSPSNPSLTPGLYLVGTPIGNLADITLRAIETLKSVRLIAAEDTRHTRQLLNRYEIRAPLMSCHKFNEASRIEQILEQVRAGAAIALVTDSGMPAISDPGSRVVSACHDAGIPVTVIPGPSSVTSALALSGFDGAGFRFEGFLSHKSAARERRLAELANCDAPVILFESPYRLLKLMREIEKRMGARRVFVAREMTKHFEERLRGTAAEIAASFQNRAVKGELVVVIARADAKSKP